jgi:prophage antirepressor-like protein
MTELVNHPEFGTIRTAVIKGEPWFVAKDVCEVLDLNNSSQAISRLDDDEKGVISSDTPGGKQTLATVNESGLYSLIFQSRKPASRKFKRWVTSEVLPSLRKYGRYVMSGSVSETREQQKLTRKEHAAMLLEVSDHLSSTDRRIVARKLFTREWDVDRVLDGSRDDVTVLAECIERAIRNGSVKRKLNNGEVRRQIIALLRGVNVKPLVLE